MHAVPVELSTTPPYIELYPLRMELVRSQATRRLSIFVRTNTFLHRIVRAYFKAQRSHPLTAPMPHIRSRLGLEVLKKGDDA